MWLGILIAIPLKCWKILDRESAIADYSELLLYLYLVLANYICGYRLYSPPAWSRFLVRQKWIDSGATYQKPIPMKPGQSPETPPVGRGYHCDDCSSSCDCPWKALTIAVILHVPFGLRIAS
jgi:hypothetical protein